MTAPTLAERIVVALASEPMSENDFRCSFPKASPAAIHLTLEQLRKAGRVVERDGVFRIPPGGSVSAEAVAKVEAAEAERREHAEQAATAEVKASAAQRRPAPAKVTRISEPARSKVCTKCAELKPLEEFNRQAKSSDGHHPWCRGCFAAYRSERKGETKRPAAKVAKKSAAPKERVTKRPQPRAAVAAPSRPVEPASPARESLCAVRRIWMLTFRDAHGVVHEVTLDDATRAAILEAVSA